MPPDQQHVGLKSVEGVWIYDLVGRQQLAQSGRLDRRQRDALSGSDIGQLNGPRPAAQPLAVGSLDVEQSRGVEVGAENGFVRAARRDRSTRSRFDHVFAFFPLAIIEVVKAVFQQRELVGLEGHCAHGLCHGAHAPINGIVLAAFDHIGG